MKSGGPWNLRGLRPETREAAREAARRAGMSVGEWLNGIIRPGDDDDYGEAMPFADYDDEDDDSWREDDRRGYRREYRRRPRSEYREPRRRRDRELERGAALAREEIGEVHARLDRLTDQLERMAESNVALTGAPVQPPRGRAPPPRSGNGSRAAAPGASLSVDDAVAEIAERQRTLYGGAPTAPPREAPPAPAAAPQYAPSAPELPESPADLGNLQEQLRYLTTRIETLRPSSELERIIKSFRADLTDIRRQLTEALPRDAVESLETEVQGLAQRLDRFRESGVDLGLLAGLERGLGEVRDALHDLTPAENLVGFDEALRTLTQKVDQIIARQDPAALQQLEAAIGALRSIVSHVASNDTLSKMADDVRALSTKVDGLASSAVSGNAVSALESRVDTLANALSASTEAGHAVPRDLEKLLSGLIEKLEWVQLTHTDHAALGALEDRIAQLIKRLDASDSRLGNLEAVERGLADLLVHIDQIRGGNGAAAATGAAAPIAVDAIERDVAEIKRSERRTQDSLEAVHGAVERVVDRLAMIESVMHDDAVTPEASAGIAAPDGTAEAAPAAAAAPPMSPAPPEPTTAEPPVRRTGTPRPPIDPNLPPDHPLEPRTASGQRLMPSAPSAADRIAASEAAVGIAKPPVIAEPGDKPNFIAAARRAAQAAAAAPPERPLRAESAATRVPQTEKPSRLRKLIVAGAAVLIVGGGLHIALHMFQDRALPSDGAAGAPPPQSQQAAPPTVLPDADANKPVPPTGPLVLPVPATGSNASPGATPRAPQPGAPSATPGANPAPPPATNPQRQSSLDDSGDITGALPQRVPPPAAAPPASVGSAQAPQFTPPPTIIEKLPATIGGPALRAAAMAGDAAAEFEVATRFAEGHGVPPSTETAARWLGRAAKQGLAPAQFRLGGFYEKGVGVKKDLAMARDLYAAAAAKGNGKAMHNLAVLYAEGINGPADYRAAAHWFRKAADRGITDSQYNLAILYARGVGVDQNYTESYRWFALAANAGDNEAAKKRDEVASHLDPQSLAVAKAAVEKWSAEPQPDDAVNVKAPPGGWDMPEHATKPKPRSAGGKAETTPGQASL